jgi:ABC-2 type transport system ATP-binding protein
VRHEQRPRRGDQASSVFRQRRTGPESEAHIGGDAKTQIVISCRSLFKRYGATPVLHDLSFEVLPGRVTGFLGPNGAGKSTTLRLMVGLARPDSGEVLLGGRPYRSAPVPARLVGVHLETRSAHPGRSGRAHLLALAHYAGLPSARVEKVLVQVGLEGVARHRVGTYSLGMAQRLGLAAALLGDPQVLLLDEPVNGLDTDGVRWLRTLLQDLARQGRTVLLSSHLMSEMGQTADHVVVIGRGRLLADCPIQQLVQGAEHSVSVTSPDPTRLAALSTALHSRGAHVSPASDARSLTVTGLTASQIGDLALTHHVPLHALTAQQPTLEEAYLKLVAHHLDYEAA